jgi:hypothetical protein
MLRKLSVFFCLAIAAFNVHGQDSTAKKSNFSFTGYVDGYYRQDFSKQLGNNRTSFTNSTGKLALGMVSGKLDYAGKKVGFTLDLGVGKRAKEFAYNDKGVLASVKQAYVYYSAAEWIKFTAGTWATHVGFEMLDPYLNRNYSMSYMFSYGPFSHTGLKSEMTFGKSGVLVGLSNQTDFRKAPTGSKPFFLLQYSYAFSDNVKIYLNYVGGKKADESKNSQYDVVFTAKLSDKFNLAYNGTLNKTKQQSGSSANWGGSAFYLNFDPLEKLGLTLRSEIFNDKNKLAALASAPFGTSIFANTVSINLKAAKGLTIVPELRLESAGKKVFLDKGGLGSSGASSFVLAAYYKF